MYSPTDETPRRSPSAPPTSSTPNVWPVIGTGDVARPGTDALAEADWQEEIGEGDPPLVQRQPVDPRYDDRHPIAVPPRTPMTGSEKPHAVTDRGPESSTAYSCWT